MCLALAVLGLCYCVGLALDAVSGVAASSCEVRTPWFSLLRLLQGTWPPGAAAPRLERAGSGAAVRGRGAPQPVGPSRVGTEPTSPAGAGGSRVTEPPGKPLGLFIFYLIIDTQHHVSFTCKTRFDIYIHEEVVSTGTLVTTRHHAKSLRCH